MDKKRWKQLNHASHLKMLGVMGGARWWFNPMSIIYLFLYQIYLALIIHLNDSALDLHLIRLFM